jgi:hypothetical protein
MEIIMNTEQNHPQQPILKQQILALKRYKADHP